MSMGDSISLGIIFVLIAFLSSPLFNPIFQMKAINSFKFFDIVGHQCHVSRSGQTCYEEIIRTNWHSFIFKLSTNNCGFYGRGTIQVNKAQWQKEFGKGILGTLRILTFFDSIFKFE